MLAGTMATLYKIYIMVKKVEPNEAQKYYDAAIRIRDRMTTKGDVRGYYMSEDGYFPEFGEAADPEYYGTQGA